MTRLFIFDIGDVVILDSKSLITMASELGVDERDFLSDFRAYNDALMEGWVKSEEYYRHLSLRYGVEADDGVFLDNYHPTENRFVINEIKRLKSMDHRTVYGSNTFEPYTMWFRDNMYNAYSAVDKVYFSNEIGLSKPKESFFRFIMEREGFDAESTVFIDDRAENVDSAFRLGITSFRYRRDDSGLKAFLDALI